VANPYVQVLRTPHALPMVAAAFIGRLPLSMVELGCVLLVASETGVVVALCQRLLHVAAEHTSEPALAA